MVESLFAYLRSRTPLQLWRDALDILIVYYVFYRALLVLRGTRAMQVGLGLAMVLVLYVAAHVFQLATILSITDALFSSLILVIVVVFQNDIRRGLQRVGSSAWFSGWARAQETEVIDEVVEAATELARHRIGAIITFEQDANLDEFVGVHTGHVLDAAVSRELLVSLFLPEGMNKLHDGAVIIRNLRIAKAGVFFPMPEGRVVDESFGSRHRAALGITEETDAVVVVVSEERGTISFCFNGNIASNLDGPKLKTMLEAIFSPKVRRKSKKAAVRRSSAPPPALETPQRVAIVSRASDESPRPTEAEGTPVTRLSRVPDSVAPARSPSEPPPPLRKGSPAEEPTAPLRRSQTETDVAPLRRTPLAEGETAPIRLSVPMPTPGARPLDDGEEPDSDTESDAPDAKDSEQSRH